VRSPLPPQTVRADFQHTAFARACCTKHSQLDCLASARSFALHSRSFRGGTRSRRTSTFTRCSVVDVSINQFRVFLSPIAHARAPWLQALSSPSSLLRAPPTPTSSSFRVIALRGCFAASPIARVGLPSSRLFFQYALARLYPGKSADWPQSSFQSPMPASHLLSSLATFLFVFRGFRCRFAFAAARTFAVPRPQPASYPTHCSVCFMSDDSLHGQLLSFDENTQVCLALQKLTKEAKLIPQT